MIIPSQIYQFKLLTDCFCGGADNQSGSAEMRIPSIRGQVRAWQREVSGAEVVNRIWGSTTGAVSASRVGLVCDGPMMPRQAQPKPCILPHKHQGPRPALSAGQSFRLKLQRLIGCTADDWSTAQNAMKLWLLLGCLGLRSNRAAGSVWPVGDWVPQTSEQLAIVIHRLGFPWPIQLVDTPRGEKAEELRRLASDTVKGHENLFGNMKPRIPSPTKFKVIELAGQPRLLVTAKPPANLMAVRSLLSGPNKAGQFSWTRLGS